MRVSTINGGFRGLRGLASMTTNERITLAGQLGTDLDRANDALDAATAAAARGALSAGELAMLRTDHAALLGRTSEQLAALNVVTGDAQLVEWQSRTALVRAELSAFARRALVLAGESVALEPWQIGIAVAAGLALVGGIAFVVSQRSTRRRR